MNVSPCRSCRRPVNWAKSAASGKPMPLDRDAARGNVLVDAMGRAHVFRDHAAAEQASIADDDGRYGSETFISHHAEGQCPHGRAWKGTPRTDRDAPQADESPQEAMF